MKDIQIVKMVCNISLKKTYLSNQYSFVIKLFVFPMYIALSSIRIYYFTFQNNIPIALSVE